MKFNRSSGIILHPTSLPGPDGIGDLGPEAYRWINFLSESGCRLWQVLPLGPTGYGDSPYQCFSAFAGNPYLISPVMLLEDNLLTLADLSDRPDFPEGNIDFGAAIRWKLTLLDRAYAHFTASKHAALRKELAEFEAQNRFWLPDFALFMAIKESLGGIAWENWPAPLRTRDPNALQEFAAAHHADIERHTLRQFLFFRQWQALRNYAHDREIQIIGDIPIFVAADSSDAWSHPEMFFFDENGHPTVVAGVPPDYFSPTGQLWGNPLYNWDAHKASGYEWWLQRLTACLKLVDIIRLDHFRGFAGYWEIPAGMPTAEIGRWVPGPGKDFFRTIEEKLGGLPIIAEDLGEITPDVVELRDTFNLPGMKIMQFGFSSGPTDPFLPHNYPVNCVAYTGTHDNDTVLGWYNTAPNEETDFCRRYLARSGDDISWDMLRAVWSSVAVMALAPMQDLLSLGSEARMNFPGRPSGNWAWRMPANALSPELNARLYEINYLYSRLPEELLIKPETK